MNTKNLTLGLGLILILCIEGLIFAILYFKVSFSVIGEELVKSLLKVIVIVFIGQVLSLTGAVYTQYREKITAENKYRSDFLDKIIPIYASVNGVRSRLLENCSVLITSPKSLEDARIDTRVLNTQMQVVGEKIIREINTIVEEVRVFRHVFSGASTIIAAGETIWQYFIDINNEYNHLMTRQAFSQDKVDIKLLPKLGDFLLPWEYSSGRKELVSEYEVVKQTILRQILQTDN